MVTVGPLKYGNNVLCVCGGGWVCVYGKSIKAKHGTLEKPD